MNSPLTGLYGWSQVVPGNGHITEFKSNYTIVLKPSGAQNVPITLHSDGEVAGSTVPCCISRCVLDQRLTYWEPRAQTVAAGECEATS